MLLKRHYPGNELQLEPWNDRSNAFIFKMTFQIKSRTRFFMTAVVFLYRELERTRFSYLPAEVIIYLSVREQSLQNPELLEGETITWMP